MRPDDGVLGGSETFRERLRGQSATMLAEAQEARYFDHDATRGVDREHIVRKRLDQFLPARYGVTTGEVRAANDEVSGQWDVLVYNRLDTPVMYSPHYTSASSVLPIEGVLAAISVRSKLDKAGIEDAAAAAGRLRAMPRYAIGSEPSCPKPVVFAFGFEGLGLETLRDHMSNACTSVESIINGICVLGRGLVLPSGDAGVNLLDDALMTTYRVAEAQTGAWGLFLSVLWGVLTALSAQPVAPNLMKHVGMGSLVDPPSAT